MRLQGQFTDGRSTARHMVRVMLAAEALHIHSAEGALLQSWPYEGLRLLEEVYAGQPLRLHHRAFGDATLTLDDSGVLARLEHLAGRRLRGHALLRPRLMAVLVAGLLLAAIVTGLVLGLPRLAGPLAALVPPEWERALGERVVSHLVAEDELCGEAAGAAALEGLVRRLSASTGPPAEGRTRPPAEGGTGPPHPLIVRVAALPGINAFAAPGGQIIILKGLIEAAETPEEVAGVLAHEMAHSLEGHPLQGLMRAMGLQLLFGAVTGDFGNLDSAAAGFGQMLVLFSFTRSDELAADRIAIALLNRAGIRGDGLRGFFERLQEIQGGQSALPSLLSTHPLFEERLEQIDSLATGKGAAMNAEAWAALRNICG